MTNQTLHQKIKQQVPLSSVQLCRRGEIARILNYLYILITIYTISMNGQGWRKIYLPEVDSTARTIRFVDSVNGWVYCGRKAFATSDGGNNWRKVEYPSLHEYYYGCMLSPDFGYLFLGSRLSGSNPVVYYTSDAGNSWRSFPIPNGSIRITTKWISILAKNKVAFFGREPLLTDPYCWILNMQPLSFDSTLIPGSYPFPIGNWTYTNMGFRDSLNGYITAGQSLGPGTIPWGLVLKSTDGGRSWRDDTVAYASMYGGVEFTDDRRGYIGGSIAWTYDDISSKWHYSTGFRYTINGGISWNWKASFPVIRGIFIDDTTLYLLSERREIWTEGGIYRYSTGLLERLNLYDSTPSYRRKPLINDTSIVNFAYAPPNRVYALRDDGTTIYIWDPLLYIENDRPPSSRNLILDQNVPNPAQNHTMIRFRLPKEGSVGISLYTLLGQKIWNIAERQYEAGKHEINLSLNGIPAGVYIYRLSFFTNGFCTSHATRRMILLAR